jgi:hypothetical protein
MALQIRKATRRKAKLRLALLGPSGSGKTMSAIKLAAGIGGKIGVIDTENGSADLYAEIADYDVITLEKPYSVTKYREAIGAFEQAGYATIIVDSLTHAWSGAGGLLDKQGQMAAKPGANSYTAWREITPEHNSLVEALLASPCHIIATMRVKTEYVIETNDRGKQVPRKVGLQPVQRDGMEYEFTVALDIDANHKAQASKDRTTMFEGFYDTITEATGRKLLDWLDRGDDVPPKPPAPHVDAPLPLVAPDTTEHAISGIETWHKAALKAIGMLGDDTAALRAWADANAGAFAAVGERYPDTVAKIGAAITARLEKTLEQESAE